MLAVFALIAGSVDDDDAAPDQLRRHRARRHLRAAAHERARRGTTSLSERSAWDVFIWYGGLVQMAAALGETGITKRFAEAAAGFTAGWLWGAALAVLLLIYFYAHYGFASITAHATAMYTPFLVVIDRGGRAARAGRAVARLLLEPRRVAHALRHHAGADLLRRALRDAAGVVEVSASSSRW